MKSGRLLKSSLTFKCTHTYTHVHTCTHAHTCVPAHIHAYTPAAAKAQEPEAHLCVCEGISREDSQSREDPPWPECNERREAANTSIPRIFCILVSHAVCAAVPTALCYKCESSFFVSTKNLAT